MGKFMFLNNFYAMHIPMTFAYMPVVYIFLLFGCIWGVRNLIRKKITNKPVLILISTSVGIILFLSMNLFFGEAIFALVGRLSGSY